MKNEILETVQRIQFETKQTLAEIAAVIGYSRPHLNKAKLSGVGEGVLLALQKEYKGILQNVHYKTPASNAKAISDPPIDILASEGIIPLADGKFLMNTPLITIKAYAGYLTSWGDEEYISELPVHPIIVEKVHRGEYKSFEVSGDSMDDGSKKSIEDKSIATARNIGRHLWRDKLHLNKFSRFVIVTLDGIVIKEISNHNTETGVITCHSLNPDKKQYPDFELSMDRVIQIFNVVQVTKKE